MQTINLNLYQKTIIPVLFAKQGDVGRKFQAVFTDGIPDGVTFSVWYSGASGEGNYTAIGDVSAFAIDGNTVTVELITQMLTNAGEGKLCLVMNGADGSQLGTWNIPYMVESVPGMGSAAAEQYFTAFSELKHLPVVANAEPGQTIIVKEVDENGKPTLWEAVTPVGESGEGLNSAVFNGNNPDTAPGESAAVVGATYEYLDGVRIQLPKASGKASTVSGMGCQATANAADASGILTKATSPAASAKGNNTIACGYGSSAEGGSTIAASTYQHVQGTFNEPDEEGKYAHIVGGGTKQQRKNIHTLDWQGNAWFLGKVLAAALQCGDQCATGVKGFYWTDIKFDDSTEGRAYIQLSTKTGESFDISDYWTIGDVVSIHNNSKYYNCGEIEDISIDSITVINLPFDAAASQADHFTDNAVYVLSKPDKGLVDFGPYASAAGLLNKALNYCATAFGANVEVLGQYGFGAGRDHKVGHAAAAFGRENEVMGEQAFSAGAFNTILGNLAAVFGRDNTVDKVARAAFIAGLSNTVFAEASAAFGSSNQVSGKNGFAAGQNNTVSGANAAALGNGNSAQGSGAHATGLNTKATTQAAHAEGFYSEASGTGSHAEGSYSGKMSEGNTVPTKATATAAHAEGQGTLASNTGAHSEGVKTTASGSASHAEGENTCAYGRANHAEGLNTQAGNQSNPTGLAGAHAEGYGTIANAQAQHAQGKFNIKDTEGKYAHIVGGGSSDTDRKNIHTLDWEGNAAFAGKVYAEGGKEMAKTEDIPTTLPNPQALIINGKRYDGSEVLEVSIGTGDDPASFMIESTDFPGCYYRTVDDEMEWINPPMALGVAYRTTERHNGGEPVYIVRFELVGDGFDLGDLGAAELVSYESTLHTKDGYAQSGVLISVLGMLEMGSANDIFAFVNCSGLLFEVVVNTNYLPTDTEVEGDEVRAIVTAKFVKSVG